MPCFYPSPRHAAANRVNGRNADFKSFRQTFIGVWVWRLRSGLPSWQGHQTLDLLDLGGCQATASSDCPIVQRDVYALRWQHFEVFWAVVVSLLVEMVNHFTRLEWPPKFALGFQNTAADIAGVPRPWMIRHVDQHIASGVPNLSALPSVRLFALRLKARMVSKNESSPTACVACAGNELTASALAERTLEHRSILLDKRSYSRTLPNGDRHFVDIRY